MTAPPAGRNAASAPRWTCSPTTTSCADGSTPGTYLTVTAKYPFNALFSTDTYLVGATLSDSIVAPLQ